MFNKFTEFWREENCTGAMIWIFKGLSAKNQAFGKNKSLSKKGEGARKKIADPFSRKKLYKIKAPSVFNVRQAGDTLLTRKTGTKIALDALKGRMYEVSLADLQKSENETARQWVLEGKNCALRPPAVKYKSAPHPYWFYVLKGCYVGGNLGNR